ncbi:MAG: hypothetical protein ACRDTC_25565 [Pseudonocardiaceae bacterium]
MAKVFGFLAVGLGVQPFLLAFLFLLCVPETRDERKVEGIVTFLVGMIPLLLGGIAILTLKPIGTAAIVSSIAVATALTVGTVLYDLFDTDEVSNPSLDLPENEGFKEGVLAGLSTGGNDSAGQQGDAECSGSPDVGGIGCDFGAGG